MTSSKSQAKKEKQERLNKALRDNLKRRKAQARKTDEKSDKKES
ncbi:hypothetical protein [Pseudemcibacter aquimaris]|nr:hypothetical protein [Pseudemcibacter aquimaris]